MKTFTLPYGFDPSFLKVYDKYKHLMCVESVYFCGLLEHSYQARTAIAQSPLMPKTMPELKVHVDLIRSYGFTPTVLLQTSADLSLETLTEYVAIGIRHFVLGSKNNAKLLKTINPQIVTTASITMKASLRQILRDDWSMFDAMTLFFPFNRGISVLPKLPKSLKYVFLANSFCDCHCEATKHWFELELGQPFTGCCANENNAVGILRQYMHLFEPYAASFKLEGREHPVEAIEAMLQYYVTAESPDIYQRFYDLVGDPIIYYNYAIGSKYLQD